MITEGITVSTTVYIATSLVWALAGFLFGYLLGLAARTLRRIEREVDMADPPADSHEARPETPREGRVRRAARTRVREQWFGALLVVLAVLSVIGVGIQTYRLNETTSCQAEWNDAYTAALALRTSAAATERAAQRELLTLMLSAPTQQEARAALQTYIDRLAEADAEREDGQIPARRCN